MNWQETRQFLEPFFPEEIRSELAILLPGELREIRIRADKPTVFVTATRTGFLPWKPGQMELEALVEALSGHSLYARTEETSQGYLTLRGGHRLGLCGRTCNADGRSVLSDIGSVCLRIAGEWPGAAAPVLGLLDINDPSVLIIGPPGSGKTTILRDLARQLASGHHALQIAVVDERSELCACINGVPQLNVGEATDVLEGLPKAAAIPWLVRSMSPQVIVTDELGGAEDAAAMMDAVHSGVSVCASVHGTSLEDAARRPAVASLMAQQIFSIYAVLSAEGSGILSGLFNRAGNPLEAT